jgi:hypothetical protein
MQSILFNGVAYEIPDTGDTDWGENLTDYFVAIPQGALQKVGGNFTLSADVNFGPSFGPIVVYVKSVGNNISTAGFIRMERTAGIGWRNQANDGNLLLEVNSSNQLTFNGVVLQAAGNYITALTGDVAATGPGSATATIQPGVIDNAKVSDTAGIVRSKLASGTSNHVLINDGSGVMSSEAQLALTRGGTGQSTKSAAFDALSPMSASGDIIYGGVSGTGTRLPKGSDGQVLTLVSGLPDWANAGGSVAPTIQKFTSGSGTYTLPTSPSPLYIQVIAVGGGGGGGGSSDTTADAGNGGDGDDTTFGAIITAGGGGGGNTQAIGGGTGGSASISGGVVGTALQGGDGGVGAVAGTSATIYSAGGNGASSALGGAGYGGQPNSAGASGTPGKSNTGGGGGGANFGGSAGLVGAGGGAGGYVNAIISGATLSGLGGSASYQVGAGGTAGTAGTNGSAGSAGGSGYLEIREYYQ